MSQKTEVNLQMALSSTGILQPLSTKSKGGSVEAMCRLTQGSEKSWVPLAEKLMRKCHALGVADTHICRRYVLKDGVMVFGIHVGINVGTAKELDTVVSQLKDSLAGTAPEQVTPVVASAKTKVQPPIPGPAPIKTVSSGRDANGVLTVIQEMPLPHVYSELNQPNAKGRGARLTGG
jgi:hypothetical protein